MRKFSSIGALHLLGGLGGAFRTKKPLFSITVICATFRHDANNNCKQPNSVPSRVKFWRRPIALGHEEKNVKFALQTLGTIQQVANVGEVGFLRLAASPLRRKPSLRLRTCRLLAAFYGIVARCSVGPISRLKLSAQLITPT